MFKPDVTTNNSDPYFFIGLSAFGTKECQRHGFPVVYTLISTYIRWIQERMFEVKIIVPREQQELLDEQFDRNITDIYRDHSDAFVLAGAMHAIDRDDARTLRVFFTLDVDPDASTDDKGRTLLHYAADKDAYHSAITLLDQGANASAVSDSGTTAVHAAAASGSISVANALLEAGADVNAVDNNFSTPLHHLLADGRGTLVQLLVNLSHFLWTLMLFLCCRICSMQELMYKRRTVLVSGRCIELLNRIGSLQRRFC